MPGDRWVGLVALPLRLFLGLIFTAAAIEKITDPGFFNPAGATYIGKQLQGFVADGSPLSFVITPLAIPNAQLFGWMMTIGELLVGLATIFGLFTRLAAVGGLLISLTLWLTAGWNAYPFYSGSDLPYAFGWLTTLLAGGGLYSLDALIARRRATVSVLDLERRATLTRAGAAVGAGLAVVLAGTAIARSFAYRKDLNSSSSDNNSPPVGVAQLAATATALLATATALPATATILPATAAQPTDTVAVVTDTAVPPTDVVALPTDTTAASTDTAVASTTTATNEPQAYAPTARPATSTPRPTATTARPTTSTPRPAPTNTTRPAATSTTPPAPTNTSRPAATSTPVPAPATAKPPAPPASGDIGPGSTPVGGPTDTPVPVAKPPVGGIVLAKIADIEPGRAIEFTEPISSIPSYLVRESNGNFVAYNSICTHAGCQVNYRQTSKEFNCPCHDSSFQISDGKPTKGPARRPLVRVAIRVDEASGNIYYAG